MILTKYNFSEDELKFLTTCCKTIRGLVNPLGLLNIVEVLLYLLNIINKMCSNYITHYHQLQSPRYTAYSPVTT